MKEIRILHTADWHLGLSSWESYGKPVSRKKELQESLSWLVRIAADYKPHIIFVAGDLFENSFVMSKEPLFLMSEVLSKLVDLCEHVVICRGNHDPKALGYLKSILKKAKVSLITPSKSNPVLSYFKLSINDVPVNIIGIPYPEVLHLKAFFGAQQDSLKQLQDQVIKELKKTIESYKPQNSQEELSVLVGHFTVTGAIYTGPFISATELEILPYVFADWIDYVALGHIHKYIKIASDVPVYYSGALIRNDFGEEESKCGVILGNITFDHKKSLKIEYIDNPYAKTLKTLKIRAEEAKQALDQTRQAVRNLIDNDKRPDYIRIVLDPYKLTESEFRSYANQTKQIFKESNLYLVGIRNKPDSQLTVSKSLSLGAAFNPAQSIDIKKLFSEYINSAKDLKKEKKNKFLKMFNEILEKIKKADEEEL